MSNHTFRKVTPELLRVVMSELGRRSGAIPNKPGRFGMIDPAVHREIAARGGRAGKGKPRSPNYGKGKRKAATS